MINYFFLPNSYRGIDLAHITQSLEGLNKAMMENNTNEYFYEDSSFYVTKCGDGQLLYERLSGTAPQLTRRLLPTMLRRMKHIQEIPDDIATLNATYDGAWANCLWGWFRNEDRNHIRSFDFFSSNRMLIAKEVATGMNFDRITSFLIRKIRFTSKAIEQIRNLGSGDSFRKVLETICALDKYNVDSWASGGFRLRVLQEEYGMNISDESDTVKNAPRLKRQRYFKISDEIGSQYCFFHIKLDTIRIHIYPEEQEKVIYIAYVGSHLDLP